MVLDVLKRVMDRGREVVFDALDLIADRLAKSPEAPVRRPAEPYTPVAQRRAEAVEAPERAPEPAAAAPTEAAETPAPEAAPKKAAAKKAAPKKKSTPKKKAAPKKAAPKKAAAKTAAPKKAAAKKTTEAPAASAPTELPDDAGLEAMSRVELYHLAQTLDIPGRTKMKKAEFIERIGAIRDGR